MVSGAELEVLRLVVKEKSPTEDQYVIDLIKKKVFAKKHESANVMEVSLSGDKNKPFEETRGERGVSHDRRGVTWPD